jgi:hypothetical protein
LLSTVTDWTTRFVVGPGEAGGSPKARLAQSTNSPRPESLNTLGFYHANLRRSNKTSFIPISSLLRIPHLKPIT